jgi:hypothetical protein
MANIIIQDIPAKILGSFTGGVLGLVSFWDLNVFLASVSGLIGVSSAIVNTYYVWKQGLDKDAKNIADAKYTNEINELEKLILKEKLSKVTIEISLLKQTLKDASI